MELFLALKKVQNHFSQGSHNRIKKILSSSKIYDLPAPVGGYPLPPLSVIWKALIYKVVIADSLIPAMGNRMSSAQVHVPKSNFDNNQDGTLFS